MKDILKETLIKVADEPEAPFSPALIGDPLKMAKYSKAFRNGPALASAGAWMGGSLIFGALHKALLKATIDDYQNKTRPKYDGLTDPKDIAQYKKMDMLVNALRLLSAGVVGYGASAATQLLEGGRYNYMGYRVPNTPRDVVIAFTGGASGAFRGKKNRTDDMDVAELDSRYGKGRYALFNNKDMDDAKEFLMNLPPGCRIRIQGHSYGGPSAYALARFASENNIPIDRLDTIDPVGLSPEMSVHGKPKTVKVWENHLPSRVNPLYWPDLIAMLGHNKREVHGAKNIIYDDPQFNDHTNIRKVDFAHDRKNDAPDFGISGEDPLSPFKKVTHITEQPAAKAAAETASAPQAKPQMSETGKWAMYGGASSAAMAVLLHRLLGKDPSWKRSLGYGIAAGAAGAAAGAGASAAKGQFVDARQRLYQLINNANTTLSDISNTTNVLNNVAEGMGRDVTRIGDSVDEGVRGINSASDEVSKAARGVDTASREVTNAAKEYGDTARVINTGANILESGASKAKRAWNNMFSSKGGSELSPKEANALGDWYRRNNIWVNGVGGGLATGGFTALLHRLLSEPENRSWRKDLAYGIPAGMAGGAAASGATAAANLFGGKGGKENRGLTWELADFIHKLKDPEGIKQLDEIWANGIRQGKFVEAAHDRYMKWYKQATPFERQLAASGVNFLHGASVRADAQNSATAAEIKKQLEKSQDDTKDIPNVETPPPPKIEEDPNARRASRLERASTSRGIPLPQGIEKYKPDGKVNPEYVDALIKGYDPDKERLAAYSSPMKGFADSLSGLLSPVRKGARHTLSNQGAKMTAWSNEARERKLRRQALAKHK